jgi:hypothetical protein
MNNSPLSQLEHVYIRVFVNITIFRKLPSEKLATVSSWTTIVFLNPKNRSGFYDNCALLVVIQCASFPQCPKFSE